MAKKSDKTSVVLWLIRELLIRDNWTIDYHGATLDSEHIALETYKPSPVIITITLDE